MALHNMVTAVEEEKANKVKQGRPGTWVENGSLKSSCQKLSCVQLKVQPVTKECVCTGKEVHQAGIKSESSKGIHKS